VATTFYGGSFFSGGFFGHARTGPGGDDRGIFKPTGLVDRPRKAKTDVDRRVDETREIHAEIAGQLARELHDTPDVHPPIVTMTLAEVDAEIGQLLRKTQRTQDEDILLLMLMAVV
jgi:hypothetical protein